MIECYRKVVSGRKSAGTIRSLVNFWSLQLDCGKVLYETLLMPVLVYGSETIVWKEEERSRIRVVQIYDLRGLLDIRKLDKVLDVERMGNDKIALRMYVGECVCSRSSVETVN